MDKPQCPLSESIIQDFKLEIILLNQKYDFLIEMKDSNFFQVNHFLKKISLGLGWWIVILVLFFESFFILFSSSLFRFMVGKLNGHL